MSVDFENPPADEFEPAVYRTVEEVVARLKGYENEPPLEAAERWIAAAVESSGDRVDDAVDLSEVARRLWYRGASNESRPDVAALYARWAAEIRETGKRLEDVTADVHRLEEETTPGDFVSRVRNCRVDLVRVVDEGIPSIPYLPASEGLLIEGARHFLPAPKKAGKSICTLTHAVDMVLAEARVAVLDRENGVNLYARRLDAIMRSRELGSDDREQVRQRLSYYVHPRLRRGDAAELVDELGEADLVVFDASRMFLTDLGLKEDSSDDYAEFMGALVDPLHQAGIATLILDNTGLKAKDRGRGSSAKGDLNEVLFSMDVVDEFNAETEGRLKVRIEQSRHGNTGEWSMRIGGGVFGRLTRSESSSASAPDPETLDAVRRIVGGQPGINKTGLRKKVSVGAEKLDAAVAWLEDEGDVEIEKGPVGHRHYLRES